MPVVDFVQYLFKFMVQASDISPSYIDTHSHLNFENYDTDREIVIADLKKENISTITVGTTVADSRRAIGLAETHSHIFSTVGIHPTHEWSETDIVDIDRLAAHSKVVAIGECGLDFFRILVDDETKKMQIRAFVKHVEIAIKHNKPLMIHCRKAYYEVLDILGSFVASHGIDNRLRGNMHFFSGDVAVARKFLDIGFTLSFAGPITFARDYDEVIKYTPLESILSETDAPFAAPAPYRGRRNMPTYVKEVVSAIATIRGENLDMVKEKLVQNAQRVFKMA